MSDGAGAVLLMRRDVAMKKGLPILGVFRCCILHFLVYTAFGSVLTCVPECCMRYSLYSKI